MLGTACVANGLLLENDVPAVFVSLWRIATCRDTYLRRGGTDDVDAAGMGDDEACRYAQETSHDDCPTGQNHKKAMQLVHPTTDDPHQREARCISNIDENDKRFAQS